MFSTLQNGLLSAATTGATMPPPTASLPSSAEFSDLERFRSALTDGGQATAQVPAGLNPVEASPQIEVSRAPEPVAEVPSPGDAILRGLNQVRQDMDLGLDRFSNMVQTLGEGPMAPQDMLKIQWEAQQIGMQFDLLGKVAGKATQNLDSLLKNQ